MIPAISEYTRVNGVRQNGLWLDSQGTNKATLHQATVSFEEMGERTITTQVRVDGDIAPNFNGWELEFRGETFVLPTLKPQAVKDNSTRNSLIDLVFTSAPVNELKRYFFAEMTEIEVGTVIIDKYVASLRLTLTNFVAAFNKVLEYYFPDGEFVMDLASAVDDGEVKDFPIDYMYIWDVLNKFYEIYNVPWRFIRDSGVTYIKVGFTPDAIDENEHIFQYGFDGGLLRFERHVEDTDIYNVLLGRGGEKNLPYRYFKKTDEYNPIWAADPDAIPELRNVFFSRLLDGNFRNYVQGWKTNPNRDTTTWPGTVVETYDSSRGATDWAYAKGHTDEKFDPVEYVKDDASIALYGVRQGKLNDNDDIFPTIQGVTIDPFGRIDEVVAVYVTEEDSQESIDDQKTELEDVLLPVTENYSWVNKVVRSDYTFVVPEGRVGNIEYAWANEPMTPRGENPTGTIDTTNSSLMRGTAPIPSGDMPYEALYAISGIPAGTYYLNARMRINKDAGSSSIQGKFGVKSLMLHCTPKDRISYRQVFTIWVKNLWETTQLSGESDEEYAHRVWDPILGDKLGKSAAVCFSDGFMSLGEDYEFLIQKLPQPDRSKILNGVQSEWKIVLLRSDAEYEATGLYIPNTQTGGLPIPGDHFYFTGVDLPIYYVKWAEQRLTQYKEEALDENAWTNPTWVINLDKIKAHEDGGSQYAGTLAEKLDAGVVVAISDKRFTLNSSGVQTALLLGIRSVSFTWNEPSNGSPYIIPDIEVVLSDKIVREVSYDGVKREITYITRNYATNSSVRKMARTQQIVTNEVAISGNNCYLGAVIGTVEE